MFLTLDFWDGIRLNISIWSAAKQVPEFLKCSRLQPSWAFFISSFCYTKFLVKVK